MSEPRANGLPLAVRLLILVLAAALAGSLMSLRADLKQTWQRAVVAGAAFSFLGGASALLFVGGRRRD